ncbi:MAG: M23 family metallopeptidase, partial [Tidjanibacter sp.]|nr:M23 family metallopeptidase [Tidjanibacter sp.]
MHPVHQYAHNHSGIDVAGPSSGSIAYESIYATLDGVVIIAGNGSGYGNYVVIDHGDGFTSVYA